MLEIGTVVDGKVTGLTAFGAFVSLPDGTSGMVHISEVSSSYVEDIKDFLTEGQEVKVKIIGVNEQGKISLSIKKALPEERGNSGKDRRRNSGPKRQKSPNVWQGQQKQSSEGMSFEDMMARFKQVSDEKMSDLKRTGEAKHGGYSRRGNSNKG